MASRVKEHRNSELTIDYDNSDIYGLGILFWEILYGKRAFEDNYDPQLLEHIINGTRRPSDLFTNDDTTPNDLPPDYVQLYTSCWHVDPAQWPSIDEIVHRLEQLTQQFQDDGSNREALESVWLDWTQNNTEGKF